MDLALDWQQVLAWSGVFSVVAIVGTAVGVPWIVARLPQDYFTRPNRLRWQEIAAAPFYLQVLGVLKNLLGLVLLVLGVVMLLTPGQGLLTLLAGLLLMNFPGKYQLERWLVLRPGVMRGLNWLRRRRGQPPFDDPAGPADLSQD